MAGQDWYGLGPNFAKGIFLKQDILIHTYSGGSFSLVDPTPDMVRIEDIAGALSKACRYAGHCLEHYSVAEHCLRTSFIVEIPNQGAALAHDFAEAYTTDIPKPLKLILDKLSDGKWSMWEAKICSVVAKRFGLTWPPPGAVTHADHVMLATEKRDLLCETSIDWGKLPRPLDKKIVAMGQENAYLALLRRYAQLKDLGVIQ